MDLERHSQPESAERGQRFSRQVQSGILASKQTDVKLCYASIRAELLKECVRSAQLSESLQQDAFHRRPIRGQFRLRHQSRHPITLPVVALKRLTGGAAARIAGFPSVLRLDAERLGNRARLDPGMADAKRNRELVFAHGIVR